jgi:hypothetical protein
MLTHSELKSKLIYNPETGNFTWIKKRPRDAGKEYAGTITFYGYIQIKVNGALYKAHRLAWFYMTGKWPQNQIDHVDCNRSNNIFLNLREATYQENGRNVIKRNNNTSGVKGVHWDKRRLKWCSRIFIGSKFIHLGYFDNLQDAEVVRVSAAKAAYGEFHKEYLKEDAV